MRPNPAAIVRKVWIHAGGIPAWRMRQAEVVAKLVSNGCGNPLGPGVDGCHGGYRPATLVPALQQRIPNKPLWSQNADKELVDGSFVIPDSRHLGKQALPVKRMRLRVIPRPQRIVEHFAYVHNTYFPDR